MRKLKKGFTLAEMLITLSIVGVITALLIPQLVDNTKKNQYGATLGKAVQQIELGISNIIQRVNDNSEDGSIVTTLDTITVEDLTGNAPIDENPDDDIPAVSPLLTSDFNLFNNGGPYLGISKFSDNATTSYYTKTNTGFNKDNVALYKFESFNAYVMYDKSRGTYKDIDIYTIIAIDVNGDSKPNRIGRDIFAFGVTTSGKLIPAGTYKVYNYTYYIKTNSFGKIDRAPFDTCLPQMISEIKDTWAITYCVVQNGFKIDY